MAWMNAACRLMFCSFSSPSSSCVHLLLNLPVSVKGKEGEVDKRESREERQRGRKDGGMGKGAGYS